MVCYLYHKDYQDDEDCQSDTSEPNGSLSAEDQAFETTLNRIVVNIDVQYPALSLRLDRENT